MQGRVVVGECGVVATLSVLFNRDADSLFRSVFLLYLSKVSDD